MKKLAFNSLILTGLTLFGGSTAHAIGPYTAANLEAAAMAKVDFTNPDSSFLSLSGLTPVGNGVWILNAGGINHETGEPFINAATGGINIPTGNPSVSRIEVINHGFSTANTGGTLKPNIYTPEAFNKMLAAQKAAALVEHNNDKKAVAAQNAIQKGIAIKKAADAKKAEAAAKKEAAKSNKDKDKGKGGTKSSGSSGSSGSGIYTGNLGGSYSYSSGSSSSGMTDYIPGGSNEFYGNDNTIGGGFTMTMY